MFFVNNVKQSSPILEKQKRFSFNNRKIKQKNMKIDSSFHFIRFCNDYVVSFMALQ